MRFILLTPLVIFALLHWGCAGGSRAKPPPPGDPSLPEIDVLQLKENSEEALRLAQENRIESQALHAKLKEVEARLANIADGLANLPLDRFDTLSKQINGLRSDIAAVNGRIDRIPSAPPSIKLPATFSPNPGEGGKNSAVAQGPETTASTRKAPEAGIPAAKSGEAPKTKNGASKASPNESQAYKKAFDLFYGGDYKTARKRFQELLDQAPQGAYADNSQYWIGECEFAQGRNNEALSAFAKVLDFAGSEKADDAQLKIGYTYLRLGDKKQAGEAFRKLLSLYPDSEYLERAKEELGKLPSSP